MKKILKNTKGITLMALVITIIVLLILCGISIKLIVGDNNLIKKSKEAKNFAEEVQGQTGQELNSLAEELGSTLNEMKNGTTGGGTSSGDNTTGGSSQGGTTGGEETGGNTEGGETGGSTGGGPGSGEGTVVDVATVTTTEHETVKAKDSYGNIVTVPKGFKIVTKTEDSSIASTGDIPTVPEGVVLQDSDGSQFVWIPVGKVYRSNSETDFAEIQLGRYTFASSSSTVPAPGSKTLVQAAYTESFPTNYTNEVSISSTSGSSTYDCKEYATRENPDGVASSGTDELNAIAKDLAGFVESVKANGGYYLARYEASCEAKQGELGIEYKLVSKVSNETATDSKFVKPTTVGRIKLYNGITQIDAAQESRQMYDDADESIGVKSDLVNSYAWDTAVVYVQEMKSENSNFSNKTMSEVGNISTLKSTGSNSSDKFCNIYDMVANVTELTTEYSTHKGSKVAYSCVSRGGYYYDTNNCTDYRKYVSATVRNVYFGFRTILYVK